MLAQQSRPQQKEKVLSQMASGSLVLLDVNGGNYYELNEVGARVWELCDGTRCVQEVVDVVRQEYSASPESVRADVLELLTDLKDESLLVFCDS